MRSNKKNKNLTAGLSMSVRVYLCVYAIDRLL